MSRVLLRLVFSCAFSTMRGIADVAEFVSRIDLAALVAELRHLVMASHPAIAERTGDVPG